METQFEELIVKPSMETSTIGPVVIVIDALDESGDPSERQALLDILFGQLSKLPINYRFILTTRPEKDIESHCQGPTVLCKRMGDISEKDTFLDIQNYVSYRLRTRAKILDGIQSDWREILANRAEGLFQWAETACQTMDSLDHLPSLRRAWNTCTSGASASLYELYHQIISNQRECEYTEFMDNFRLIVGAIITTREPLTMNALENIFEDIVEDVKSILRPFGSLLVGVHDVFTPIRPLHTSLLDFFHARNLDATHENKYYVDTSDQSLFTFGCLMVMNRTLRFNICNLETSHLRNRDVPNFFKRVGEAIPLHLSYACCFWGSHLQNSVDRKDCIFPQLRVLMEEKLLYWFEALSLLGEVEKGRVAMRIMQIWCQDADNELADQAVDARQFGFNYGDVIEESTPHLYLSALPFTSRHSFISKKFSHLHPRLFSIEGGRPFDSVPKTVLVKKNAHARASSLAFSPQGKYIATGFDNGEFWFWNFESGEILHQWKIQKKSPIQEIVFSPDGQSVYCCFTSSHIHIWNIRTKEMMDDPHLDILNSEECWGCTVSSDGHYIIFHVHTGTLLLCDRMSRQQLIGFQADYAVFSPKGDMLVFLNRAGNLCLWDIHQQALVHSWWTDLWQCRPTFSNGQIIFGLGKSIQVWNIHTLTMVCEIEIMIKPDLIFFASGQHLIYYFNNTYAVWDISTGEVIVESSLGRGIRALAVSSDSKYIALSTYDAIYVGPLYTPIQGETSDITDRDCVKQLWMRGRHLVQLYCQLPYEYHLLISDTMTMIGIVFQVQVSPKRVAVSPRNDNVCVAFVTTDGLSVWDDTKGLFVLDESTGITILKYSPFGDRLITAESGSIIKIWDVTTHSLIGGPHEVPGYVLALAFSATGDNFVVAYRRRMTSTSETEELKATFIEVRECQSGHLSNMVCPSTDETKIILTTDSSIEILGAVTGESEVNSQVITREYMSLTQLSPNSRYIGRLGDQNGVELWDVCRDNQIVLWPPNGHLEDVFFSDGSTHIITLYIIDILDNQWCIDIWDISTGKIIKQGIRIYSLDRRLVCLHGNHLILSDENVAKIVDLDVHQLMSSFYEHHKIHSLFGMFPIDNLKARQEIQMLTSLTSHGEDILEYALRAWDKALFSMHAEISQDGWVLGPHNKLLIWIPEKRRSSLWRPCMTHMGGKYFTKLNFDNFVHGARQNAKGTCNVSRPFFP